MRPVRGALLQKLCGEEGVFALGVSVARVVQLASSDDEGTQSLAYYVLADAALTQKILRLANTTLYRSANGTPVSTVSRAISLLGFDNVKMAALAMLLVDTLSNSRHAHSVRRELEASLCASLIGRELGRRHASHSAEEASISALFKNIGPLLIASREHARFREIGALVASGKHSQGQASQMILGSSFDALSAAVLQEWQIPDLIVRSLRPLAPGLQKLAASHQEWLRQAATFGIDAAQLQARQGDLADSMEVRALLWRFGAALNVDQDQIEAICATVQEEMRCLLQSMNMPAPHGEEGDDVPDVLPLANMNSGDVLPPVKLDAGLPDVLPLATIDADEKRPDTTYPSGKPVHARELLQAGVQEVTQMRVAGHARVNELILAVLETLYHSMGFRFAAVCLKDARRGQYRARLACGEQQAERQAGFAFPLIQAGAEPDLFHLAMENDADVMIADARAPMIRSMLPAWHRTLLPDAHSFIVLPLVVRTVQLGLFYADRIHTAPEGVGPEETALIRALKEQVLVALTP